MRKDNKGRNLRTGESQRQDSIYMYRYTDLTGKRQYVYSWKLTEFDRTPNGKNIRHIPLKDNVFEVLKTLAERDAERCSF